MLACRNVNLANRRTSIRLEAEFWAAADECCRREGLSLHDLCTLIDEYRGERSLTAALRVALVDYYRAAATETGHVRARHGAKDAARAARRWRRRLHALFTEA